MAVFMNIFLTLAPSIVRRIAMNRIDAIDSVLKVQNSIPPFVGFKLGRFDVV